MQPIRIVTRIDIERDGFPAAYWPVRPRHEYLYGVEAWLKPLAPIGWVYYILRSMLWEAIYATLTIKKLWRDYVKRESPVHKNSDLA